MKSRFRSLAFLAGLSCTIAGCGRPETAVPPGAEAVHTAKGRIRGVVTLRGAPPASKSEVVTKDQGICGSAVPVTRLQLGRENAVRGAFVYLDGVPEHGEVRPRLKTEVEQKDCEYGPHVLTLALRASGSRLRAGN